MNYKQALEAQHLAAPVMRVLEGLDVQCPDCQPHNEDSWRICTCVFCKSTGKISYFWQPQVGEWVVEKNKCYLVVDTRQNKHPGEIWINTPDIYATTLAKIDELTPILHWETIEEILEKAGYAIEFVKSDTSQWRAHILSDFNHRDILSAHYCKSRLPAVYEAVIELGKELK